MLFITLLLPVLPLLMYVMLLFCVIHAPTQACKMILKVDDVIKPSQYE